MDALGAFTAVVGPVVTDALRNIYRDWRTGRDMRRGMVVDRFGGQNEIPNFSGMLSVTEVDVLQPDAEVPPVFLSGDFVAEPDFAEFTDLGSVYKLFPGFRGLMV